MCLFWRKENQRYSLSDSPEVGQQVLRDSGDELFGCVIQQVTLQHIKHSMQSPHSARQMGTA